MSSLVEAPVTSGEIAVGTRRERRVVETQEIRVRSTHRRRKVLTRSGVLVGFALAMVIYPVYGTIAPYADAAETLPGVVKGQSPTTAAALLGGGPQLLSADLPLPSVDELSQATIAANIDVLNVPGTTCNETAPIKGSNGRLAKSSLCALPEKGESLQAEAAGAFIAMNQAYKTVFGRNICLDDSYRSLANQYSVRATRGYLAATPGTSMHGWGLAVDLCSETLRGASGKWIQSNAHVYGWENPPWAKSSKYEPWHWEYISLTQKYYDTSWGSGNYSDGGTSSKSSSSSSSSSSKSTTTTKTTTEDTDTDTATEPTPAPTATAGS
ncbi:MAG: M15 family metallopeptidase [Demequina sp.]|nr:M15 family metallopeptidase [Demequina sp.]